MLRSFIGGLVVTTLFTTGAALGFATQEPPDPHVRLPDRGSPQTPGSSLEGLGIAFHTAAFAGVVEIAKQQVAAEQAELERRNAEEVLARPVQPTQASSANSSGTGACASGGGYDAVPGYIIERESGGDYCIQNPSSSACGKYQILDTTWNGYGGYASACDAPPAVQDEKAASMAPCHWQPPNYCAG